MDEKERTDAAVQERLRAIEASIRKCSGVMRKMSEERARVNPHYWTRWINGYGDHLQTLANEMTMIRSILAKRLS